MYQNYFNDLKGFIIPHAGIQYAGDARRKIFENLTSKQKNIKKIIYLSALHNPINSTEKVFILNNDNQLFSDFFNNTKCNYIDEVIDEHSFTWVKDEIYHYFNEVNILALCPTPYTNYNDLAIDIINYMNSNEILLISTTDLIHYGKRFNNLDLLNYPYSYDKLIKEEDTIDNFTNNIITISDQNNICGPYSIKTFLTISKYYNWKGKVIDYYDSSVYNKNEIEKHIINFSKENNEFVSYVSIVYGNYNELNILPIDLFQTFGIIKSILYSKLLHTDINIKLPKWNIFNKINNGIFISTELNNKTNSCTGVFQNSNKSSENITTSTINCINDSINRWKIPINLENIDLLNIKIEIIEDISLWKSYPSNTANNNFIMNGDYGMYLKLNNNTATFLPSVAEDNKNIWTINEYMEQLSIKSNSDKNSWENKEGVMFIYKTNKIKLNKDKITFN